MLADCGSSLGAGDCTDIFTAGRVLRVESGGVGGNSRGVECYVYW